MAREIKIVKRTDGELDVRNIPDALAPGEKVVAARWQDGGEVFHFFADKQARAELAVQAGAEVPLSGYHIALLYTYIGDAYGADVTEKAIRQR